MTKPILGIWSVAISITIAFALAGCSSSGGSGEQMTPGEDMTIALPLEPGGLVAGGVPDVFAHSAADTLKSLLPTGAAVFAPMTGAVKRNRVEPDRGTKRPDQKAAYLNSIASDGTGGFHVTYVIEGVETPVHFAASDYSQGNFIKDVDGTRYYLWSLTGSFDLDPDDPSKRRDDGNPSYDYVDNVGWEVSSSDGVNNDYRGWGTYGVRASNLPSGRATYGASMYAELWAGDDPNRDTSRTRVGGNMVLEADFEDSEISGRVHAFQVRPPGASQYVSVADGNSIDISNGRIAEGRFTAQWIGRDTDANSATEESVRGFEGTILGQFYGPEAEETGGVLNGSRAATDTTPDQQLTGYFRGYRRGVAVPDGDLSLLSVAAYQDYPASTTQHTDAAEVTTIESDGAGGYRVTYVIDGGEQEIHMAASDYGSLSGCWSCYHQRIGNRSYFLWDFRRSLSRMPEFDHFNVGGWSVADWSDARYTRSDAVEHRGLAVYGTPTGTLPTGTANYEGRTFAEIHQRDDPNRSARSYARGRLALTADFDASTVDGSIDEIEVTPPGDAFFVPSSGNLTIGNGVITDNELAADLTGTQDYADFAGNMIGQFFGPAAAEVGGVLQGTYNAGDSVVLGSFGGTKQ